MPLSRSAAWLLLALMTSLAMLLATLVDAGKIGWVDRVIDRLPGFQMYDS